MQWYLLNNGLKAHYAMRYIPQFTPIYIVESLLVDAYAHNKNKRIDHKCSKPCIYPQSHNHSAS